MTIIETVEQLADFREQSEEWASVLTDGRFEVDQPLRGA
jgi:hypothetical protein